MKLFLPFTLQATSSSRIALIQRAEYRGGNYDGAGRDRSTFLVPQLVAHGCRPRAHSLRIVRVDAIASEVRPRLRPPGVGSSAQSVAADRDGAEGWHSLPRLRFR